MTVFEQSKEQGDWFPFFTSKIDTTTGEIIYDPPEEGAAEFCFRSPEPFWEEKRKGRTRTAKFVKDPDTRQMVRVPFFEDQTPEEERKERDDSWDYAITGMKGARWTADGPEMECTRENKLKLLKNSAFLRYANRVLQLILETGVKEKESSEKNSQSG